MTNDELVRQLTEAGFHDEARQIASVTPEQEAAFEEWLDEDDNRERWEAALASARNRLSGSNDGN